MAETREPLPGEKCVCGKPAVIVYVKKMGEVPVCTPPKYGLIPKGQEHGARPSHGER